MSLSLPIVKPSEITPYPNGWFVVAFSHELAPGSVQPLKAFGRDLVLFRTEDGEVHLADGHCPHFGAHLGHGGRVEGNCIRCPFHGWHFEGESGQCKSIPNGDLPPKLARLRKWSIEEKSGMILTWHHDRGHGPDWHVDTLPEFDAPGWSDWLTDEWTIDAKLQDIAENDADIARSPAMHSLTDELPKASEPVIEGPVFSWNLQIKPSLRQFGLPASLKVPDGVALQITTRRYGLAFAWIRVTLPLVGGLSYRVQTIAYTLPVDESKVQLRLAHRTRKTPIRAVTRQLLRFYRDQFHQTVDEDIPVWENKIYLDRPAASRSDAGVLRFRKWARQFYTNPVREKLASNS